MHAIQSSMTTAMLGLALLLAGGCVSADRHVYESTSIRPATVKLIDTIDQETLWTKEIPVDHRLVVRLKRQGEPMALRVTGQPATSLSWGLYESPRSTVNDRMWRKHVSDGGLELDGRPVRLEVDYQPAARRDRTPEVDEDLDLDADDVEDDVEEAADDEPADDELARQDDGPSLD